MNGLVPGANLAGSDFTGRLVPRLPTAQTSQPCAAPAAPPVSSTGGAAFCHFTESGPEVATGPGMGRPAEGDSSAGRTLSDHTMILLRAVASYERCSDDDAIAIALAHYAKRIGAGPLARAVLDERERVARQTADDVADDLHDLPDIDRRAQSRFGGTWEPDRNLSRGMRR